MRWSLILAFSALGALLNPAIVAGQSPPGDWRSPSILPGSSNFPPNEPAYTLPLPPPALSLPTLPALPPTTAEQLPTTSAAGPPANSANQEQQALITSGQTAFNNACITCHDADKALAKR